MIFAATEEQELLRQSVRAFLADTSPITEVRRLMETDTGYDPGVWKRLSAQLGLVGITIPEELGGSGSGYAELAIVLEEMGRSLYCGPYFATVALAANAIMTAGTEHQQLVRIAELVHRRFGVHYTLPGLDLLLHRVGWSVRVPARHATERSQERVTAWKQERWPVIKGRRRTWVPGSASKTNLARA